MGKPNNKSVSEILHHIRHYLPSQGPIKDFIHHNTLHMFQDENLEFHEAIRKASQLYGAREYLLLSEYRNAYTQGKISNQALDFVLKGEGSNAAKLREQMLHGKFEDIIKRNSFRQQGYLASLVKQNSLMLEELVHPTVYRLVANYLDQGIAGISLSEHCGQDDFWQALQKQLLVARPFGIPRDVSHLITSLNSEDVADHCLRLILPDYADREVFLLEVLMAARGWSGLIAQLEDNPGYLNYPRKIKLVDYVALYLSLLAHELEKRNFDKNQIPHVNPNSDFFRETTVSESQAEKMGRLWHEALEYSFYFDTLGVIQVKAHKQRGRSTADKRAKFQAIFCIDDRECSVRRYLEEVTDDCETFGTPGFFGIDAVYQGPFDAISVKQCPVPVEPQHRIRGVSTEKKKLPVSRIELNFWHRYANSLWLGWAISLFLGIASLVRLILSVHRPAQNFATASSFAGKEHTTDLLYERSVSDKKHNGYYDGYTVPEMAERVARVLKQIGLTQNFAPLVSVIGHGSTSTNNPYFAAYDCGACSGRPGLINARTFALMANRPDVREILRKNKIIIPDSTRFVGAIHDTARDELMVLDEELHLSSHNDLLTRFKKIFGDALAKNAHERTRRFAIIDFPVNAKAALHEVRLRTEMLFEPRPEYNHATNALAIVGRRSLTENLFLDRRAFFNSYDPLADKDGSVLTGILSALVPVCGGINLEYFFSRVDNTVYGAGSKLPHNVFALVGVGNGSEGDLRTGLPEQMIEIHDPLRLMILVEQKKSIVEKVFSQNPAIARWIIKDWVKFCIYDIEKKHFYWWQNGKFTLMKIDSASTEIFPDSVSVYVNKRENLRPVVLRPSAINNETQQVG